ncbi:ATP-binding cassette domain-containing protein [Nocardiopsis tropica]|uniref:ATP-binding cassette domain-containing protein n=1 Tax=Nocardiopsis tropica TaxID=109330 RepID=A0ABU7KKM5_9ACTN|nr:ATP-binding cassette domain-containing protein [Nocardiopsis umidischolae]MEE2049828.1 ATP-binding cassette domain-containing protein [Nocardiopsis umidischolae]
MSLIEVTDLRVSYPGKGFRAKPIEILHGVTLDVAYGETVGLVGESGSGKTTIGRAVLGLVKPSGGSIRFAGQEISSLTGTARRGLASHLQVVFQDPYTSLNPSMTIGDILSEPLIVHGVSSGDARGRVRSLLDQVGLPSDSIDRLPREFSGGQRQRVAIARALAPGPQLIVCDEPVSGLDLSTQSRVLDLFLDIQRETGVSYLFISHDLGVIRHISHRVTVLYRGELVETGPTDQVTSAPEHPYTERLLLASPVANPVRQKEKRDKRRELLAADLVYSAGLGGTEEITREGRQ